MRPAHQDGFTLIELMVTVTIMSILMALAFPSMAAWMRNSKVRTVADALQNGLRTAQTDAMRRSRQVVFSLTDSANPKTSLSAAANGSNWSINTVKLLSTDSAAEFVESGVLTAVGSGVQIAGPAAICFNSLGRLTANTATGVTGGNCASASAATYAVTLDGADRPLRVTVTVGGQVRMCDPNKSIATRPDGCV
ncbi:pilus assembly FimT family protein [Variovorax sp. RHLX14]